jgi:molecular chaperone HscB
MSDPFAVLGIAARFDLDMVALHRHFVALASANHPDRFIDEADQADAAGRAAEINRAYRVLSDPASRAEALLAHWAAPAKAVGDQTLPPDLLDTMLDVREELEQALMANDSATLARLRAWAAGQRGGYLDRIAALFARTPEECPGGPAVKEIRVALNALRYCQRVLDRLPSP